MHILLVCVFEVNTEFAPCAQTPFNRLQERNNSVQLESTPALLWTPAPPPPLTEWGGLSRLLLALQATNARTCHCRAGKSSFFQFHFPSVFLLVYGNIIDFYIYIPVLVTANSFIRSSFFWKIILSVNKDSFIYSFPILCHHSFLFFWPYCTE